MTISDDTLMAYADGELDAAAAAEVEQALRQDPALAERVRAQRALRARLQATFGAELAEPVPERLQRALVAPPATVVDLAAKRAQREQGARRRPAAEREAGGDGHRR